MRKNKLNIIFFLIIAIGIFFRFYNLNWGAPFYFHPDERNIASATSQLSFPTNMNPHFFAYGSLPIYTIYFIGVLLNFFYHTHQEVTKVGFENAILIGRTISAIFSVLVLFLLYKILEFLKFRLAAIVAVCLGSFSVGLIQYAHFATFEMWLTFFLLLFLYTLLLYVKTQKLKFFILTSILFGLFIAIKVSSLVFLPILLIAFIIFDKPNELKHKCAFKRLEYLFLKITLSISIIVLTVFFTCPFFWLDNTSFLSSIHYESSVALGTLPVFYSQEFEKTIPIFYQLFHIYPFILNPIILIVFLLSLFFIFVEEKKSRFWLLLIIFTTFIIAFLSQAFLFVKWTRYYIPTLPFIYLFIGIFFEKVLYSTKGSKKKFIFLLLTLYIAVSFLFSFSYFKTVLLGTDTRVLAADWSKNNIPHSARILSETYDLGIVPFNNYFSNITLFNFYELDENTFKKDELEKDLTSNTYIILPSQRIVQTRIKENKLFANGYKFYNELFAGNLGFEKIYETKCDFFCNVLYLGSPIFSFEQTASVFDRPTVFIFKHK